MTAFLIHYLSQKCNDRELFLPWSLRKAGKRQASSVVQDHLKTREIDCQYLTYLLVQFQPHAIAMLRQSAQQSVKLMRLFL